MMSATHPIVFEFAYLCKVSNQGKSSNPDWTFIPDADFDYLETRCLMDDQTGFDLILRSCIKSGCRLLQVKSYAGLIPVPSGQVIEVLPKVGKVSDDRQQAIQQARGNLLTMLQALDTFRHIKLHHASLATINKPLIEVFITCFLDSINQVIKRGLRCQYLGDEDNLLMKRGKLNVVKQIRHNSLQQHRFYCEFDEYIQNRPINRLLKSALLCVKSYCKLNANQKLLRELLFAFDGIPASADYKLDLGRVRFDRGMDYYKSALAWSQLILDGLSPQTAKGLSDAPSLLFPMESVFEAFVAKVLQQKLPSHLTLRKQSMAKSLAMHKQKDKADSKLFTLKPDLLIEHDGQVICILDTKWKLIDANDEKKNFGLSQSDFYQMFAYAKKYQPEQGVVLVYPETPSFCEEISGHFEFDQEAKLWATSFKIGDSVRETGLIASSQSNHWPETIKDCIIDKAL